MHNAHDSKTPAGDSVFLPDESATLAAGAALARSLAAGMRIYLSGDLGTGKTTLVRGMLRGLGFRGKVKSPTFTLVEVYAISSLDLYHFDLYRFNEPSEWEDAGFREYFSPASVCLVEWPEKAGGLLPPPDLEIHLSLRESGRLLQSAARTPQGRRCLAALKAPAEPG
jgi:tRNA threonylcarbamoyladenosine biosynthesis protein TsaE